MRPWIALLLVGGLLAGGWSAVDLSEGKAADAAGEDAEEASEEAANATADTENNDDTGDNEEGGIGFPSDRLRERQFDRGRRLVADQRWSDAATLFDEILASDRDCFFRTDRQQRTWQSIKSETNRLIGGFAKPGREAYELQFRARAERMLEQAVSAGDSAGIVAVARRWFHTPAGYRATLLAAIESLEVNQPLAAAAWLDRLAPAAGAAAFEPTLSIMRAVAWLRAGDGLAAAAILEQARNRGRSVVRLAGKDVTLSFPAGGGLAWLTGIVGEPKHHAGRHGGGWSGTDWAMHRGDPARNGVVVASCPLLAPRYRVPLARHPEESRLLEARRRLHSEQELAVLPAGGPLAVDGTILVHTSLGLLAVDFETGKRIWLQSGAGGTSLRAQAPDGDGGGDLTDAGAGGAFSGVFEDATSGIMASDGRLVFVVESHADAMSLPQAGMNFRQGVRPMGGFQVHGGWRGGNTLSAYDVADRGALRWRLPARNGAVGDEAGLSAASTAWYLGAPLPVGEQLLVLVEEKGEIRLDVLDANSGLLEWSQPFAEVDEERAIDNRDSHARRLAGLSPALAEGVLVCPTGAGAVVAIDLATRTLLWAHEYPQPRQADVMVLPNGMRVARNGPIGGGFGGDGGREQRAGHWLDSAPILAGGRVLLTPGESQELLCLDLRRGTAVWRLPRKDRLYVAGVVAGRAIVVGRRDVEALDLGNGRVVWQRPLIADQGSPSGRGILTANRLFLPLDTPEVLEVDLADGSIVSRSPARGNAVPGNLLAYRGEVISQGGDSLDVFHQSAALELRIETALKADPQDAWALLWRGQLELDRGAIASGIALVREAHALQPSRVPSSIVATAFLFALQRDFPQAASIWREAVALSGSPATAIVALRATVDGFLRTGDLPQAWEALQQLMAFSTPGEPDTVFENGASVELTGAADGLVIDGVDQRLCVAPVRWIQGRLAEMVAKAAPPLRAELDAFAARELAAAMVAVPAAGGGKADRITRLREFVERFGRHEKALEARSQLAEALHEAIETVATGDDGRGRVVERDFVLLDLARVGGPADREHAAAMLAGVRRAFGGGPADAVGQSVGGEAGAWPIGRVVQRRGTVARAAGTVQGAPENVRFVRSRLMNIPVFSGSDSFLPGIELAVDEHQQSGIIAMDGYGRPIGDAFGIKPRSDAARLVPMFQSGGTDEAAVVGRVVFVRAGANVAAFEMAGAGGAGQDKARNRPLWMIADKSDSTGEPRGMGFVMNVNAGRVARQGNIPLGARVSEPRNTDESRRRGAAAGLARCTGVAIMADRTLKVYEPLTGRLLWERQRLPAASELFGDDDFLCVCPVDGRNAIVLSMADGRLVRTLDLPGSERRLLISGRQILSVRPSGESSRPAKASQQVAHAENTRQADQADGHHRTPGQAGQGWARTVCIDLLDPVDGRQRSLGEYPGESRAAAAGDGRLAVVEPSGDLSLLDLENAAVIFRSRLSQMPAGLESLRVLSWMDRYLVLVGRAETAEEQRQLDSLGAVTPLPGMPGREMPQLVTGSLWAVDAASGGMLWPVPATVLRHSLQGHCSSQLPVLLFARSIQSAREPERQRLSVLCLDKRTGQAVYVDDRFNGRAAPRPDMMGVNCCISGDPVTHTIALSQGRRDAPELQLDFTGGPTAPRPPFQASAARASAPVDPLVEIEYWIKKALTIPLPF